MTDMIEVSLWRGKAEGAYQTFHVPQRANQTVLDVVTWVQRNADPTLSYRFACRVGMCGSCAMTVNGVARWTCRTHIDKVAHGDRLEIGMGRPTLEAEFSDLPFLWLDTDESESEVFALTRADLESAGSR